MKCAGAVIYGDKFQKTRSKLKKNVMRFNVQQCKLI